jgi:D123
VIRSTKDHVTIMDFSPFNENYTSALAFDWKELTSENVIRTEDEEQDDPEFRYLANDVGIQPNSRNNYGIPQDVINMFKASSISENEELDEDNLTNMNRLVIGQMEDELRSQDD